MKNGFVIFIISYETKFIITLEWKFDDISDHNMRDMEEFTMIFCDCSGELWK